MVIGTRAVMYAPVEGPALFAILEDAAYQNMDGMMPYPQARGVMRLRAKSHGGVFVAMANARTPQSQWENTGPGTVETPVSGYSTAIHPLASPLKDATPWVRWLNRDELARLADPSIGRACRIRPSACYLRLWKVAPVLLSIPQDNVSETLSCAKCHRQVRCAKCSGPLQLPADRRDLHRDAAGVGLPPSTGSARAVGMNVCAWCVWGLPALRRSWPDCSVACQ